MSQGKLTKSFRRSLAQENLIPQAGFKGLLFAHEFTNAGETVIDFNSLVAPEEFTTAGLVNPSPTDIVSANLGFSPANVTLSSSVKGLILPTEYKVRNNQIQFITFTSEAEEYFVVKVDSVMRTGLSIADARPFNQDTTLLSGQTDVVIGEAMKIEPWQFIVFRGGVKQDRNSGNSSTVLDKDYYVIDAGNGYGTVIRFNTPAVSDENITVTLAGALVERADVSMMQQIENIAGQLDAVIPTVAALAGVPESNFQSNPNSVDLLQFGGNVLNLLKILNVSIPIRTNTVVTPTIIVGATTTAPTKSTIVNDRIIWYRDGKYLYAYYEYHQTGTGGNGVGDYLYTLPAGLQMDSSLVTFETGAAATIGNVYGLFTGQTNNSALYEGNVVPYNATQFRLLDEDSGFFFGGSTAVNFGANIVMKFGGWIKVPILGWEDTATIQDLI